MDEVIEPVVEVVEIVPEVVEAITEVVEPITEVVETIPELVEPVVEEVVETIPEVVEPIPEVVEPIPEVVETVVEVVEPVVEVVETVPKVVETVPELVETIPEVVEPIPEVVETVVEVVEPIPEIVETVPEVVETVVEVVETVVEPVIDVITVENINNSENNKTLDSEEKNKSIINYINNTISLWQENEELPDTKSNSSNLHSSIQDISDIKISDISNISVNISSNSSTNNNTNKMDETPIEYIIQKYTELDDPIIDEVKEKMDMDITIESVENHIHISKLIEPPIELPPIELPPIELPPIELPPIEMPPIKIPSINNIANIPIPSPDIITSPIVTFTSANLNEIKSFSNNKSTNSANMSSINSGSDFSYTKTAKKFSIVNNSPSSPLKHIRTSKNNKSKSKNHELDEVDFIYNKVQDFIRYMNVDRFNYIIVIIKSMEIIENSKETKNVDNKKDIVTKALNRIVMVDLQLSEYDQALFLLTIDNLIELIIICTKTKSNINVKKSFNDEYHDVDDIIFAKSGQIIHSLTDKITTIVLKKQYTADKLFVNMATITDILMILVDKYGYLTGNEKKTLVLQAIDKFVKERLEFIIELSKEKKVMLIKAIDSISLTIDMFIALQKGKYKINSRQILNSNNNSCFKFLCCGGKKEQNNDDSF